MYFLVPLKKKDTSKATGIWRMTDREKYIASQPRAP